ncbi:MAG: YgaP family membrane protein [Candidatus Cyclobacteriaceae bacterium M2_1C_046]
MKINMGKWDRVIRFILAAVFIYLFAANIVAGTWGIVLLVFGGIFFLTSLVGFCPLYAPFGLSTCRTKPTGVK